MFNSKALWWTFLIIWILGSVYWHLCRIRQLCDVFYSAQSSLPKLIPTTGQFIINLDNLGLPSYHIDISELGQHIIMLAVTLLLGFVLGYIYQSQKTRELRYKLNRIDRELAYYQSKR